MKVLDLEEANRLLAVAEDEPLGALYVLALTTGMRLGELLGLRWQDIDLDGGYGAICRSPGHRSGHARRPSPMVKTGRFDHLRRDRAIAPVVQPPPPPSPDGNDGPLCRHPSWLKCRCDFSAGPLQGH